MQLHIDPRVKTLVTQNNEYLAKTKQTLMKFQSSRHPIFEFNKSKIDQFNTEITEIMKNIEQYRDFVNRGYQYITSKNEVELESYIDTLQNYINTTESSIKNTNQLIDDLDIDYDYIQGLFKAEPPKELERPTEFNIYRMNIIKNLRENSLKLNEAKPKLNSHVDEQWYFMNIRENQWVPFAPRDNEIIVASGKAGVKEIGLRHANGKILGTVDLARMKFYLPDNRCCFIKSEPI
jgi:hypothetical protein